MKELHRDENPTILNPKPENYGFIIGKNWNDEHMCAAVPVIGSKTKLAIIYQGSVIKICNNALTARKFIATIRKNK